MAANSTWEQPPTGMIEPPVIDEHQAASGLPVTLVNASKTTGVGLSEAEKHSEIEDDSQLMGLLDVRTKEAIEYGDPESRQGGIRQLALTAVRELGLPACLGNFIDLDDQNIRGAIKAELTRQKARGQQASYANQDMNTWEASLDRIEPLVRLQLSAEENEQLSDELTIWAEEMYQKASRISHGLSQLREH